MAFPEDGPLDIEIQVAPGAEGEDTWAWPWRTLTLEDTDEGAEVLAQVISARRGQSNESGGSASNASIVLTNRTGRFTPGHLESALYPDFDRGCPLRIRLPDRDRGLRFPWTPDPDGLGYSIASISSLTSTQWWAFDFRLNPHQYGINDDDAGDTPVTLARMADDSDVDSVWWFQVQGRELVIQLWNTVPAIHEIRVPIDPLRHNIIGVLWTSSTTCLVYEADYWGGPWTLIWTDDAGASALVTKTARVSLGHAQSPHSDMYPDCIYRFEWRNTSSTGTIKAQADFTTMNEGATGHTDSAGNVWTRSSALVEITNRFVHTTGRIYEIAPTWPGGDVANDDPTLSEAQVTLTVSDVFRTLARKQASARSCVRRFWDQSAARMVGSVGWPMAVLNDSLTLYEYWPLEDSLANAVPGGKPIYLTNSVFDFDFQPPGCPPPPKGTDRLAGFDGNGRFIAPVRTPGFVPADQIFVLALVCVGDYLTNPTTVFNVWFDGTSFERIHIFADPTNGPAMTVYRAGGASTAVSAGSTIGEGEWAIWWYHMGDGGGGTTDHFYGVIPINQPSAPFSDVLNMVTSSVQSPVSVSRSGYVDVSGNRHGLGIGHLMIGTGWTTQLGDTGAPVLAEPYRGYPFEAPARRAARVASEEGLLIGGLWPAAEGTEMGPQRVGTFTDILEECLVADAGRMVSRFDEVGADFRGHRGLIQLKPRLTLDVSQSNIEDLQPVRDDQRWINDVEVKDVHTSASAHVIMVQDERFDKSVDLNASYEAQLEDHAYWEIYLGTTDDMRYPTVVIDLGKNPTLWEALFTREGDRFRLINLPAEHPHGSIDLQIEGIQWDIGPDSLVGTFTCGPGAPWLTAILGDATYGRVSPTTSVLTLSLRNALLMASTSTVFTADHSTLDIAGDLDIRFRVAATDWTPAANQILEDKTNPFDATAGGYRVTLTTTGLIALTWSNGAAFLTRNSTVGVGAVDTTVEWIRVTLDVDNGAAGHDYKVWTSDFEDPGPSDWTQHGATVTTAGVTTIGNSVQSLVLGTDIFGNNRFTGYVRRIQVRNGIEGTVVSDADFSRLDVGTKAFFDTIGRGWAINGGNIVADPTAMVTASPVWIDTAGFASEFPFDIDIDGERCTVTAISGTAAPQIFTLTRGVDGATTFHDEGADVQLWTPAVLAL